MFRCYSYTVIGEGINLRLLKLQLLKQSTKIQRTSTVYCRTVQHTDTNRDLTCSHTTTVLTAHRFILIDYFNNCNFSKHKLMCSLMMV